MASDSCILFLHHSTDDLTLHHYELVKKYNSDKKIYSVGFANHNLITNSHVVTKSAEYPKNDVLNKKLGCDYWSEADLLIYDFYRIHKNIDVYYVIEYDTYSNCSIEKFYGCSMNMDAFSHVIHKKDNLYNWDWYAVLTDEQKRVLHGISWVAGKRSSLPQ